MAIFMLTYKVQKCANVINGCTQNTVLKMNGFKTQSDLTVFVGMLMDQCERQNLMPEL